MEHTSEIGNIINICSENSDISSVKFADYKLYTANSSGDLLEYNYKSNKPLKKIKISAIGILDICYNKITNNVGIAIKDGTIKIFNSNNFEKQTFKTLKAHTNYVNSVSFSNNGKYLVSSSNDNTTKISQVYSAKVVKSFSNHKAQNSTSLFINNDKNIITGSFDKTINIIDIETSAVVNSFKMKSKINKIRKLEDEGCFGACDNSGDINIFDMRTFECIQRHEFSEPIKDFNFSKNGVSMVNCIGHYINIFDLRTFKNICEIYNDSNTSNCIDIHDSENIFAAGYSKSCELFYYKFDDNPKENLLLDYLQSLKKIKRNKYTIRKNTNNNDNNQTIKDIEIPEDPNITEAFDKIISQLSKLNEAMMLLDNRVLSNEESINKLNNFIKIDSLNWI